LIPSNDCITYYISIHPDRSINHRVVHLTPSERTHSLREKTNFLRERMHSIGERTHSLGKGENALLLRENIFSWG